jgi:hypothetical protein
MKGKMSKDKKVWRVLSLPSEYVSDEFLLTYYWMRNLPKKMTLRFFLKIMSGI